MYNTELMKKILTSKTAQKAIQNITNKYGEAEIFLTIFNSIGGAFDEYMKYVESMSNQIYPQSSTWFIPWLERRYGINVTELDLNNAADVDRRRKAILQKRRIGQAMNPVHAEDIISEKAGNAEVHIYENSGKNRFKVFICEIPANVNQGNIVKTLNTIKPAHICYDIQYYKDVKSALVIGGMVQKYKEINLVKAD